MLTDPTHPYVTTTATLPEEVVVGDKSKDWKISLLEERLESRIIMTKGLEAKVRNLQANLDAAHRELAGLRENLEGRYSYEGSLQADVHVMVHAADDLAGQLSEARATITALRAELAGTGEGIGDAFGVDASDEEEASFAKLPTVAEVVAAHDAELIGATDRMAAYAGIDAMPIPPSSPGVIELLIAVDKTIRYFRHRHLNKPDCETINLLETAREGIVGMPCDAWMSREEHERELTSLRTQLARAAAIEAKAKAAWREFRDGGNEGLVMTAMRQLRDSFSASPAPEPAEPKCSHCGTGISPENLTCGGCGRWLGKPAAKPTAARLAILERVAKEAKAFMDAKGDGVTVAYQAFRLAISDLEKLEATPCRSR